MVFVFPGFIGLTLLLVNLQKTLDVKIRRTWIGDVTNRGTCRQPPSTLGDFGLYTQKRDAAFYDCPDSKSYLAFPLTCPIIYCQADGTFSTPDFSTNPSNCYTQNEKHVVVDTSGEITTPNYPANYNPISINKLIIWSIMTPGTNIVFRIEDIDIDSTIQVAYSCADRSEIWTKLDEAVLLGLEIACNKSCAAFQFYAGSGSGGRGFNISFRTQE